MSYLTNVKIMPGHKNTTLAIARPFLLYASGVSPAFLNCDNNEPPVAGSVPVMYALLLATIYVYARASARAARQAKTEQTFQAVLTPFDSCRSGQKRSKKKAAPKMVATKMPTKMLYEAIPTKSLL